MQLDGPTTKTHTRRLDLHCFPGSRHSPCRMGHWFNSKLHLSATSCSTTWQHASTRTCILHDTHLLDRPFVHPASHPSPFFCQLRWLLCFCFLLCCPLPLPLLPPPTFFAAPLSPPTLKNLIILWPNNVFSLRGFYYFEIVMTILQYSMFQQQILNFWDQMRTSAFIATNDSQLGYLQIF